MQIRVKEKSVFRPVQCIKVEILKGQHPSDVRAGFILLSCQWVVYCQTNIRCLLKIVKRDLMSEFYNRNISWLKILFKKIILQVGQFSVRKHLSGVDSIV